MRKKNYYSESLKLFWKNKLAVLSLLILVILTVSAILAPALTPYDPNKQVLADKLLFPSAEHLFGTYVSDFGIFILGQYGPADPRHSPAAQGAGVYSGLPN